MHAAAPDLYSSPVHPPHIHSFQGLVQVEKHRLSARIRSISGEARVVQRSLGEVLVPATSDYTAEKSLGDEHAYFLLAIEMNVWRGQRDGWLL